MKEPSEVTALVFDRCLFLPLARRLAKGFKRVLYHPWKCEGSDMMQECIIGDGFPDIEWCEDFWSIKNEIDLFVFPDCRFAGLQLELERQGFPVWGSRKGDWLENNRHKFHKALADFGLEVPPHENVTGISNLRSYLKDKENVYIKIDRHRSTMETVKFRNWDLDEALLDKLAVKFGGVRECIPFIVCDEIETDLEIGGDGYNVDGQWPQLMLHGDETKDRAYLAAVTEREKMPEQIQEIMMALSPVLKECRYRNQISFEDRVQGDKHFYIDATQRGGLPSSGSQYAIWKNLPEIVWYGAHGVLVQPEPEAKFAAECILTLKKRDEDVWGKVRVPEELMDQMNCSGCCEVEGALCFPSDDQKEIGWLVATGDTIEETIETMKGYADLLPDGVDADTDALVDLLAEIKSGEEQGIDFTEQEIPEPATALNV